MSLVFVAGRKQDSLVVQPVENAHYAILACNLLDITSKFYVVARFIVVCLEAVRHINLIDAFVLHCPMSLSNGSLDIFIKYKTLNNFLKVPYCSTFYKNITLIKVASFPNVYYHAGCQGTKGLFQAQVHRARKGLEPIYHFILCSLLSAF